VAQQKTEEIDMLSVRINGKGRPRTLSSDEDKVMKSSSDMNALEARLAKLVEVSVNAHVFNGSITHVLLANIETCHVDAFIDNFFCVLCCVSECVCVCVCVCVCADRRRA
jgi:hypothetical protein